MFPTVILRADVAPAAVGVTDVGVNAVVTPAGSPVAVRATGEVNEPTLVAFTEIVGPLTVARAGHFLQWERADLLNQCLIYFFADLRESHGN